MTDMPEKGTVCPACETDTRYVLETRDTQEGYRRRRVCPACGFRWTTIEIYATPSSFTDRKG